MKKSILIAVLFILCAIQFWQLRKATQKPNNQYEVFLSQKEYILQHDKRVVSRFAWGSNPAFESAITTDNQ